MAETDELLPCPFCGNPPKISRSLEAYPAEGEHPAGEYETHVTISCHDCGIEMHEEYRTEVIERWNARAEVEPKGDD